MFFIDAETPFSFAEHKTRACADYGWRNEKILEEQRKRLNKGFFQNLVRNESMCTARIRQ